MATVSPCNSDSVRDAQPFGWPTVCCCGSGLIPVGVSPGSENERAPGDNLIAQGEPIRSHCLACWPAAPVAPKRRVRP